MPSARPVTDPKGSGFRHPLMGADLLTLWRARRSYGPVSPSHLGLAALMVGSSLGRWPFRTLERLHVAWRNGRSPSPEAPLFIVGHWRSGTTHLHNLLARSPEFGLITPLASGLPWELLTLATWLRPLLEKALPEDRHVDRIAVNADSPQEDEIPVANMQPLSVFHAVYFPRHFRRNFTRGVYFEGVSERDMARWKDRVLYFHKKVSLHQRKRRLLVKNPVYMARIGRLLEIWPDAKFIHIYRNPYTVYASTVHYYRRLLPDLALQEFGHVDLGRFVLEEFPKLLDRLYAETRELGEEQFTEVRFEDLEKDPLPVLERIHTALELSGWAEARPRIEAYLDSISGYRRNEFSYPAETIDRVGRAWVRYVDRWGYTPPT